MADGWLLIVFLSLGVPSPFGLVMRDVPAHGADPSVQAAHASIEQDFFEQKIRPLLIASCQSCHGPDEQSGGLRLDSREAILRGGESGPATVAGDAGASLLVHAIRRTGELKMPPDDPLSDEQVSLLVRWVEQGLPWTEASPSTVDPASSHWAFQPISDPPLPIVRPRDLIAINATELNAIDTFINAQLVDQQLVAAPPADRRTLIRRLSLDLTGLFPTDREIRDFMADQRPDCYERLVDRYLNSPFFGEQWGRHWLDVARYSDTKGYVYGREERTWVHAWSYRDWVVQSLNNDMPYDQFLLLQLAADQAAHDQPQHWPAMGFLTLGRRFLGIPHDIIDDRIDVVSRGMLGLTVACARCHSHKYDPIPTEDYYSLYGVFRSSAEQLVPISAADSSRKDYPEFEQGRQERQDKLDKAMTEHRLEHANRVRARLRDYLMAQFELEKYPRDGFDVFIDSTDVQPTMVRRWQDFLGRMARQSNPIFEPWHRYARIAVEDWNQEAPKVHVELQQDRDKIHPTIAAQFTTVPSSRNDLVDRYVQVFTAIDEQWKGILKIAAAQTPQQGQNPQQETTQPTGQSQPTGLNDPHAESLRAVLYGEESPCEIPREPISESERHFDTPSTEALWKLQGEVDRWSIASPAAPAHAMLLVDRKHPVDPFVFRRGNPLQPGKPTPRQFLQCLAGSDRRPFQQGSGRLELAQAIVDPQNPLTARVMVNRIWQGHFGRGLVDSASDFGRRAAPPTHPALLDWLATRLIQEKWSLKKLHRRIVLSAAYQRGTQGPENRHDLARARQIDPDNRFLWRKNPHRLSFEEMRDALFQASNGLRLELKGKPADLFAPQFVRRTLYGMVDRQFLPDTFRIFDFANPDLHMPARKETSVPQQGLFFLNDRLVIDRATALADYVARLTPDATEQVSMMYSQIYQRPPTPEETASALQLVQSAQAEAAKLEVTAAPTDAHQPKISAWAQLAQVLLSTNEFMFVD